MDLLALLRRPAVLEQRLQAAFVKRLALVNRADSTAFRVVNGSGDAISGLTIDRFADVLVVSLYEYLDSSAESVLLGCITKTLPCSSVYLKRRPKEARHVANTQRTELAPLEAVWGENLESLTVLESGMRFLIRPGGDLSVGIFLDMRDTRAWLRTHIGSSTVLNCFAYTCGFGVAASLGGALRVVNLDLSKKVLDWGTENYRLNGIVPRSTDFIHGDVFEWFKRFVRRGDKFDAIILDPPSFATAAKRRFSVAANYDDLVAAAAELLEPNGLLLACCNHAKLSRLDFKKAITRGLERANRGYNLLQSLGQSNQDYPVKPVEEAPLKVFALEIP